jgi:hypothetical protein
VPLPYPLNNRFLLVLDFKRPFNLTGDLAGVFDQDRG